MGIYLINVFTLLQGTQVLSVMASNHFPESFVVSTPEAPLDLTVKRSSINHQEVPRTGSLASKGATCPQIPATSSYSKVTREAGLPNTNHIHSHPCPKGDGNRYYLSKNSHYTSKPYNSFCSVVTSIKDSAAHAPGFDINALEEIDHSGIVFPKKRKSIWRPYDNNGKRLMHMENDMDSGSDTDSNSSSNHEPEDPVKRRKKNMLRFAETQARESVAKTNRRFPHFTHRLHSAPAGIEKGLGISSETSGGHFNSQDCSYINGTSGIFQPELYPRSFILTSPDSPLREFRGHAQERTEVDKRSIHPRVFRHKDSRSRFPRKHENYIDGYEPLVGRTQVSSMEFPRKELKVSDHCQVDNVCDNPTEHEQKALKIETKKGVSLIDLVEEIESDAVLKDQEETEKTKQRNASIVKLLEQCNYVKLRALDYLMSSVLIQDRGSTFKNRNEKVQKMLKGDKITSVNMLDVLELQVEMGLN